MEEKSITISIGYDVQDTYFKFPQQAMANIVDALHNNDKIVLHLTEGIALEELNYKEKKFLQILKELCAWYNLNVIFNFIKHKLLQSQSIYIYNWILIILIINLN